MSKCLVSIVLLLVLVPLTGCHAKAQRYVRAAAWTEAIHLSESPATIEDPEIEAYLDDLGLMVLHAARDLESDEPGPGEDPIDLYDQFDVRLVHSTTPNAWVYGDNFTCVTTKLLLDAETPEEIVAVLCHEFAHLKEEHLVEAKEREYTHYAVGDLIEVAGIAGEVAAMMYGVPVQMSALAAHAADNHRAKFDPYEKGDEFEADRYGIELYAAMGLDLQLFDDFFERTLHAYGDRSGEAHPRLSQRIERLRTTLAKLEREADDPPRHLDQEPLRAAQRQLADVIVARLREDTLVSHEQRVEQRLASGVRPAASTSCWPPAGDSEYMREKFFKSLRAHATQGGE